MSGTQKFFIVVGGHGMGKDTLINNLRGALSPEHCVFLCDSRGSGINAPYTRFTNKITEIGKAHHHEMLTPMAQLLLFWAGFLTILHEEVLPHLRQGKFVFINGLGDIVLAQAMQQARDTAEQQALVALYMSLIEHCLYRQRIAAPRFLLLAASPAVAYERLEAANALRGMTIGELMEQIRCFRFYKTDMPHRDVREIDASQSPTDVCAETLAQCNLPHWLFKAAA